MTTMSDFDFPEGKRDQRTISNSEGVADIAKIAAARHGVAQVRDGMNVGMGTGSTAEIFIRLLGERVRDGLRIRATATSARSAEVASGVGIGVEDLDRIGRLDVTVDGADEVDPRKDLIKGGGGALLREKIVAAASDRFVVIVDEGKMVDVLGSFPVPIEVIPFGKLTTQSRICTKLRSCGYREFSTIWRERGGKPYVTDEGNAILDLHLGTIGDAGQLSRALNCIPGVVETGLFINMVSECAVGTGDGQVITC